jgi:hypothetical protein
MYHRAQLADVEVDLLEPARVRAYPSMEMRSPLRALRISRSPSLPPFEKGGFGGEMVNESVAATNKHSRKGW